MSSGDWEVVTFGGPQQRGAWEISVVRKDYKHGHVSYGWFGDAKIDVSSRLNDAPSQVSQFLWDVQIHVAHMLCEKLNNGSVTVEGGDQ